MRQIGVRDSARIVGSLGICGRELCCTRFLTSFEPISIKMAKKQELVLNTSKLSGSCGRLMCCLGFEYSETGHGDTPLPETETIALSEDAEETEVIIASSEPFPEAVEPAHQLVAAGNNINAGPPQTEQQSENPEKKGKRRKWYPRKRKKKPQAP